MKHLHSAGVAHESLNGKLRVTDSAVVASLHSDALLISVPEGQCS